MNDITISNGFSVVRTSKSGKETYRGPLGVSLSGNKKERGLMTSEIFKGLVRHNNWRAVMREVCRVFPASILKKAPGVVVSSAGDLYFSNMEGGKETLERFDASNPNTSVCHAYAVAVLAVTSGKALKGEKAELAGLMAEMLEDAKTRAAVPAVTA